MCLLLRRRKFPEQGAFQKLTIINDAEELFFSGTMRILRPQENKTLGSTSLQFLLSMVIRCRTCAPREDIRKLVELTAVLAHIDLN